MSDMTTKAQVSRLHRVMREMTALEESHRHGTATSRATVEALQDMFEVLQKVASVLSQQLPEEE